MRTAIRAGAALLLAIVAGAFVAPTASGATTSGGTSTCQPIEISGDTEGFTSPASVASGMRTFHVTTTDPHGIVIGLFQLDPGVDVDDFVALMRVALVGQGEERVEAGEQVAQQSTLLGGVAAAPGMPASFTQVLWPNSTYYLANYRDLLTGDDSVAVRTLTVTNQLQLCPPPLPRATINVIDTADGPRFRTPSAIAQGSPILVRNLSGGLQEAVIRPVGPEVTAEEVRQFFEALDNNQPPPSNPFTGLLPQGLPVIHPAQAAIIQPSLSPGRYAVLSFLLDSEGRHYAARGLVAVLDVT